MTGTLTQSRKPVKASFQLLSARERHVPSEVKNASAIGAAHQLLFGLAGHQGLRRQFHVATAAHAVVYANDDILALALD